MSVLSATLQRHQDSKQRHKQNASEINDNTPLSDADKSDPVAIQSSDSKEINTRNFNVPSHHPAFHRKNIGKDDSSNNDPIITTTTTTTSTTLVSCATLQRHQDLKRRRKLNATCPLNDSDHEDCIHNNATTITTQNVTNSTPNAFHDNPTTALPPPPTPLQPIEAFTVSNNTTTITSTSTATSPLCRSTVLVLDATIEQTNNRCSKQRSKFHSLLFLLLIIFLAIILIVILISQLDDDDATSSSPSPTTMEPTPSPTFSSKWIQYQSLLLSSYSSHGTLPISPDVSARFGPKYFFDTNLKFMYHARSFHGGIHRSMVPTLNPNTVTK